MQSDDAIMGSDQELLRDLCCGHASPLNPKQVAFEAGVTDNGLYQLWNQHGRVVPARVWRACVNEARRRFADQPHVAINIVMRVAELVGIADGIGLYFASDETELDAPNLCEFTADLLEQHCKLIRSIAAIMADGRIGPNDAGHVDKYRLDARLLITRLLNLESALIRQTGHTTGARHP
ncbi:MAG TPA: hypothetical protein VM243_08450 [Phycisphaerae bacterium]|nr:hypothetical protein [Phycisphaerae bacterium]